MLTLQFLFLESSAKSGKNPVKRKTPEGVPSDSDFDDSEQVLNQLCDPLTIIMVEIVLQVLHRPQNREKPMQNNFEA